MVDRSNERFRSGKYCIWRILAVVCIGLAWTISLSPLGGPLYAEIFPTPNTSQNEILLQELDLSNVTVLCPYPYTYSADKQSCQLKCGLVPSTGKYIGIRVIYGIIGLINIGISIFAIYRSFMIRKTMKFQHHPIFIGILSNLLLACIIGIPDVIGVDIFYCENRDIDYDTLHESPPIQLHIMGALITISAIATRLWFVMAVTLILISVSFPMKDLFYSRRNRIVIIVVEIAICAVYPFLCALGPFIPFTGYKLSEEVLFPVPVNIIVSIICENVPHTLISGVTITVIVLIIYRIHSQVQIGAEKTGKPQAVHPIEKRLLFFSITYYILISIISVSIIYTFVQEHQLEHEFRDYLAMLTLRSLYSSHNSNSTIQNQTLTLLPRQDQLLVQESRVPFNFEFYGLAIRMIFILVLPVLNFPCKKLKCKKKKTSTIVLSNKVV